CKLLDPETFHRRGAAVVGSRIFVEGGTHVLDYLPGPLVCAGRAVPAREIRHRLREAYRAALDKHGVLDRLCPVRAGKCPEEIAASVRRLFSLQRPELAAPGSVQGRAHQFRYGSESVSRQGRHPQLGRIFERVADLTDPGDVARLADGVFEVALTPTVANQVFYFFSLRRRDY